MPNSKGAFAARLAARRVAAGFTQEQLAERAGVNRVTLAKYESGADRHRNPTLAVVRRLASALGCTVADLVG